MSHLMELIKALVPHILTQQERDDAYLNEAVDVYDVERRIWELDHRTAAPLTQSLGGAVYQ